VGGVAYLLFRASVDQISQDGLRSGLFLGASVGWAGLSQLLSSSLSGSSYF
jgi:hypothetical protein